MAEHKLELATLAGGCFWCTEAVLKRLRGVISVKSGYSGGKVANPTYEQVSAGNTGHTEAIQIEFDPSEISFREILSVFLAMIDPTTKDRQGTDVGSQYRSVIFYHNDEQKKIAEEFLKQLELSGKYKASIVTEVVAMTNFYPAEENHQDFYNRNREYGYCRVVIDPKIQKLYKEFSGILKE